MYTIRSRPVQNVYDETVAEWKRECQNAAKWVCTSTPKQQKMLDKRSLGLGGERCWISLQWVVFLRRDVLSKHTLHVISVQLYVSHGQLLHICYIYVDGSDTHTLMPATYTSTGLLHIRRCLLHTRWWACYTYVACYIYVDLWYTFVDACYIYVDACYI
jgi:hypothetical protein